MTEPQLADALQRTNAKLAEKLEKPFFFIEAEDSRVKGCVRVYATSIKPTPNNSLLDFTAYELNAAQSKKVFSWSEVLKLVEKDQLSAYSITLPLSRVIRIINPKQVVLAK